MTFEDLNFGPRRVGLPGVQAVVFFDNSYGASIIKGHGSYGADDDLYELAVLKTREDGWDLCYDTEITDDVIGHITPENITSLLERIESLA